MKGLVLKDFVNLKNQMKLVVPLLIFYIILFSIDGNTNGFIIIVPIFTTILGMSTFYYDEKAKWDKYALTMNISRKDLVLSKYITSIIISIIGVIIVGFYEILIINAQINKVGDIYLGVLSGIILLISLLYPFLFKFGYEKGRLIIFIVAFSPTIVLMLISKLEIKPPSQEFLDKIIQLAPYVVPIIIISVLFVSVVISLSIVNKKDFA